jgi:S-adenosylmethionine:tRNA ribosyltransferase-isomerase
MIIFDLPKELIAQEPVSPRDTAKLLVYNRKSKTITDTVFSELINYLDPHTTLVVNNSKVEHCRWLFDDGKTEIFVLEKLDPHTIRALVRPGKKFKLLLKVQITEWLQAEIVAIDPEGIRTMRLNIQHDDQRLTTIEHVPLPPYIAQNDSLAHEYQTVYAKPLGSKAAPTAGLHFTKKLLTNIKRNYPVAEVTLHVGLGTFAGITEDNYKSGTLHSETYKINHRAIRQLEAAEHVTAVGTTTTRTLESWKNSGLPEGSTNIFIQPGYTFQAVDSMITNFHLPGTSLLLMIEAFIGDEYETNRIYQHAIAEKYRFYSFGDAMLIL